MVSQPKKQDFKVTSLPATLEPDAVYYVKGATDLAGSLFVGSSTGAAVSFGLPHLQVQATTGFLKFDNGSSNLIPFTDGNGWLNFKDQLKFYADLDGDGDYDADIWSKDNLYVVAESGIHLRMNYIAGQPEEGRLILKASNGTNYIQSARNYSGSTRNDLAITDWNSSFGWVMFDQSQNGWAGFGFAYGEAPAARVHAKDAGATIGVFESSGSTTARVGFRGTGTTSGTTVTVGASGNDLALRAHGATKVTVGDAAVTSAVPINAPGMIRVIASSGVSVSTTGNTTENALATVTIPAGAMGANGWLRITTNWSYSNSANTKTARVRVGGTSGTAILQFPATTTARLSDQRWVYNRNNAASQISTSNASGGAYASSASAPIATTVDTSAAFDIVLSAQNTNAGETITLESYTVELFYDA